MAFSILQTSAAGKPGSVSRTGSMSRQQVEQCHPARTIVGLKGRFCQPRPTAWGKGEREMRFGPERAVRMVRLPCAESERPFPGRMVRDIEIPRPLAWADGMSLSGSKTSFHGGWLGRSGARHFNRRSWPQRTKAGAMSVGHIGSPRTPQPLAADNEAYNFMN